MKIYRAVFQYNNGDSCEWERWYNKRSVWYSRRDLAEQHLPEFNKFKEYLLNDKNLTEYNFKYREPYIEEQNIYENFAPTNLDYKDIYHND